LPVRALTTRRLSGWRRAVTGAAIAVAVATLLVRLPASIHDLRGTAQLNDARGSLAAADGLDIDNGLAAAAPTLIPRDASYTVVPPHPGLLSPITYHAIPGYFRYLLLPRRLVRQSDAQYVICYLCRPDRVRHPVQWVYARGWLRIGKFASHG
jgi:hypothetical protein